jgi:hypothetical protein
VGATIRVRIWLDMIFGKTNIAKLSRDQICQPVQSLIGSMGDKKPNGMNAFGLEILRRPRRWRVSPSQ